MKLYTRDLESNNIYIGCLNSICKTITYLSTQIANNERISPTKILNSLSSWLASPIDKPTLRNLLKAMHALCTATGEFSYENMLFTKHIIYLQENRDNEDKLLQVSR